MCVCVCVCVCVWLIDQRVRTALGKSTVHLQVVCVYASGTYTSIGIYA